MTPNLVLVNTLNLKSAAVAYALEGFYVFPLQPGTKEPYSGSRGVHEATNDPVVVAAWWDALPNSNIALAGGYDWDFIDLDCKRPGQDGVRSWQALDPELPRRLIQRTPSGGLHVLLPHYEWNRWSNFVNRGEFAGIDMRTKGGYIVAAPSWVWEGGYSWQPGTIDLPFAPAVWQALGQWSRRTERSVGRPPLAELESGEISGLLRGLPERQRAFLEHEINWREDCDDSRALWDCVVSMYRLQWPEESIMSVLASSYAISVAERHHRGGDPLGWLWRYTVASARQRYREDVVCYRREAAPPQDWTVVQQDWMVKKEPADDWVVAGVPSFQPDLTTNPTQHAQVNPLELAKQRVRRIPFEDEACNLYTELSGILREAALAGVERDGMNDLMRFAAQHTPATMAILKETWRAIQAEVGQQRLANTTEPQEIYVVSLGALVHQTSGTLRSKDAFLTDHANEFNGDRQACEESYLIGAAPRCRRVDSMTYDPSRPHGVYRDEKGVLQYNQYRPGMLLPRAGDVSPWMDLLHRLDFEGGEKVREAVLDYLAYLVQNPGEKINHALLLGGAHGIGKDSLIQPLIEIFGAWNVETVRAEELMSSFTSFLARNKLLLVSEIEYGDDRDSRRVAARLKPILAAPPSTIRINEKNVKEYQIPNLVQMIAFTNSYHRPVHMDAGERRYLCAWSQMERVRPGSREAEERERWFENYYQWLENGGSAAVYHYLLQRDVSRWNPKASPMETPWSLGIQESGLSSLEEWLIEQIDRRTGPFYFDVVRTKDILPVARMAQLSGEIPQDVRLSNKSIGAALTTVGARPTRMRDQRMRIIRNAHEVRKAPDEYWRAVWRCVDVLGVERAIEMTPEERALWHLENRNDPRGGETGNVVRMYGREPGMRPRSLLQVALDGSGSGGEDWVVGHGTVPDWMR